MRFEGRRGEGVREGCVRGGGGGGGGVVNSPSGGCCWPGRTPAAGGRERRRRPRKAARGRGGRGRGGRVRGGGRARAPGRPGAPLAESGGARRRRVPPPLSLEHVKLWVGADLLPGPKAMLFDAVPQRLEGRGAPRRGRRAGAAGGVRGTMPHRPGMLAAPLPVTRGAARGAASKGELTARRDAHLLLVRLPYAVLPAPLRYVLAGSGPDHGRGCQLPVGERVLFSECPRTQIVHGPGASPALRGVVAHFTTTRVYAGKCGRKVTSKRL